MNNLLDLLTWVTPCVSLIQVALTFRGAVVEMMHLLRFFKARKKGTKKKK